MIQRWKNLPISTTLEFNRIPTEKLPLFIGQNPELDKCIEIALKDTGSVWTKHGTFIPVSPKTAAIFDKYAGESEGVYIEVEAKSTGYSDPGKLSGPAEDCYPPEDDDEREIVKAKLFGDKDDGTDLEEEELIILEEDFMDDIYTLDLPDDWD